MKKVLGILVVAGILLAGCVDGVNDLADIDGSKPYSAHLIADPDLHGWLDYLKEQREESEKSYKDIFVFHKVDSTLESKELVKNIVDVKDNNYITLILVALGPDSYKGKSTDIAKKSFNELKSYAQELIDITLDNKVILLIGNGYPKTAEETDEHLLWNHEQMRLFLKDKMEKTNRIYNFSLKRPLSDETGVMDENMTDEERYIELTNDLTTYLTLIKKRI